MKKLLEAELVSIAHRILKLKGRENIEALLKEAQLVTQKLSVLKFYEDYKYLVEKEISQEDFDKQMIDFSSTKPSEESADLNFESKENDILQPENDSILEETSKEDSFSIASDKPIENENKSDEIFEESLVEEPEQVDTVESIIEEKIAFQDFSQNKLAESEEIFELNEEIYSHNEVASEPLEEEFSPDLVENENQILKFETHEKIVDELIITENEESQDPNLFAFQKEDQTIKVAEQKLEDLFQDFGDFDFVKPEDNKIEFIEAKADETSALDLTPTIEAESQKVDELFEEAKPEFIIENPFSTKVAEVFETKTFSLNDKLSGGVKIGLNDKIGFVKHLFDGSEEDFTRVVSQLNTFNSHQEALDFVENIVKPDYNNWENKEDYALRFFGILERSY